MTLVNVGGGEYGIVEGASDSDSRAVTKVGGSEVDCENIVIMDQIKIYKMIFKE